MELGVQIQLMRRVRGDDFLLFYCFLKIRLQRYVYIICVTRSNAEVNQTYNNKYMYVVSTPALSGLPPNVVAVSSNLIYPVFISGRTREGLLATCERSWLSSHRILYAGRCNLSEKFLSTM